MSLILALKITYVPFILTQIVYERPQNSR